MFHDRIRSARIKRGYTIQQMADSAGVPMRHYQKFESGEIRPTYETLVQIADFLSVPIDFLLGRDNYLKTLGVSVDVPPEGPPRRPKPKTNRLSPHTQFSDNGEE